MLNGVKILIEDLIMLSMLISCVYKDNIFSIFFLGAIIMYMSRRKVKNLKNVSFIIGTVMLLHYALALSNLHSHNNPMPFPFPFENYPTVKTP